MYSTRLMMTEYNRSYSFDEGWVWLHLYKNILVVCPFFSPTATMEYGIVSFFPTASTEACNEGVFGDLGRQIHFHLSHIWKLKKWVMNDNDLEMEELDWGLWMEWGVNDWGLLIGNSKLDWFILIDKTGNPPERGIYDSHFHVKKGNAGQFELLLKGKPLFIS